MCHMQNFLLTTFKELRPNKIDKIHLKKMGKWTQSTCLAIFDETVPGHGCEVSVDDTCTPGNQANENVINALKQKVLDMYTHWHVNSSWHSDAIWQLRSGSTLAQLMVCCLTAPSHYLNLCWLINCLRDMHLRAISKVLKNSICNLNEKFTLLKYFEHLPGTDVLNNL